MHPMGLSKFGNPRRTVSYHVPCNPNFLLVNLSFFCWVHIEITPNKNMAMIEFIFLFVEIALADFCIFFPQQCVHTEGFFRWELKPGLDQGGPSVPRHFSCEFSHKMALACPCAFRLRGLAQTVHPNLGPRHFSCKFSHQMAHHEAALVTRPCAFRLRRLAQTVRPRVGPWHFSCKFSREISLVIWSCGFRLRRLFQNGCPACKSFMVHSWRPHYI